MTIPSTPTPNESELETAMSVLLWLHETEIDGRARDDISHVRSMVSDAIELADA